MQERQTKIPHIRDSRLGEFFDFCMMVDTIPLILYPKGKLLLKEGRICNHAYYIETGQLRAYYCKNGKQININFYFEGDLATNLKSYLSALPSEYNICTIEPTIARVFEKNQFFTWYRESDNDESQAHQLLQSLLMKQQEHSNLFKLYNPTERYHYIAKHNPMLLQRIPLTQVCSYLGISRETISRIRRKDSRLF